MEKKKPKAKPKTAKRKAVTSPKNKMIQTTPETKEIEVPQFAAEPPAPEMNFTRDQIELIKTTIAKDSTDDELKLFINICKTTRLNPFIHQVHFIKRWNGKLGKEVGTIQVGIDGFRAIAESSGRYAGSEDAIFKGEGTEVKTSKGLIKAPESATVTVYKLLGGSKCAFTATARWNEYFPGEKQGYMWGKMPFGQLAKCAEALALRKAFPKLLSGVYADEEMEQATEATPAEPNSDLFTQAKEMISKANDAEGLGGLKSKVLASEKYTEKQKDDLIIAINERLAVLIEA